jgi:hypothetical protein
MAGVPTIALSTWSSNVAIAGTTMTMPAVIKWIKMSDFQSYMHYDLCIMIS